MILRLPRIIQFIARHFSGMRKFMAKSLVTPAVTGCNFEGITYPFDVNLMDGKRLIAIASGSIESEEVALAQKYLGPNDVIVEFGSGLGVAAARVHKAVKPKAHYCFEANPDAIFYSYKLFKLNHMKIKIEEKALGNGSKNFFYAVNDYILSSFEKPKNTDLFNRIEVSTIKLSKVVKDKRPTAIFCDIEGAERNFLPPEDLHGVSKVIIELHPGVYGNSVVRDIKNNFIGNGFFCVEKNKDTYCFIRHCSY